MSEQSPQATMTRNALVILALILSAIVITFFFIQRQTPGDDSVGISPTVTATKEAAYDFVNRGEYDKAIQSIDAYLAQQPADASALTLKASILANKGSAEFTEEESAQQALRAANRAIEISPNKPETYYVRGYAYEIQNDFAKAIADYEKALELDKGNGVYLVQLGHVYDLSGDPEKAKSYYEQAVAQNANNAKALINLGRYEQRYGDEQTAKTYFEQALPLVVNPLEKAGILYSLGMIALNSGELEQAYTYMDESANTDPDFPQARIGRAWVSTVMVTDKGADREKLAQQNITLKTAEADLQKAIELNPQQTLAYLTMARMYLRFPPEAEKSLEYFDRALAVVDADNTIMQNDKAVMKKTITTEKQSAQKLLQSPTYQKAKKEVAFTSTKNQTSTLTSLARIFVKEAQAYDYVRCTIGPGTETDYCPDRASFNEWITLLRLAGHTIEMRSPNVAYCSNGSIICLGSCGVPPPPHPVRPPPARCGSGNGTTVNRWNDLTGKLCRVGNHLWRRTSYNRTTHRWTWYCGGKGTRSEATCHATRRVKPGQCNSALNNKELSQKPTTNLCTKGTPGQVVGEGTTQQPWTWTCNGVNGGKNATCSARAKAPACGSANGTEVPVKPTTELCSIGAATGVTWNPTADSWTWKCENGTKSFSCEATRGCVDPNSIICNNTCMPPVTFSSQVNLRRGGGADPAKINIPQGIYCDLDQNGDRESTNGTFDIPVTSHPFNLETQCGCDGGRNINPQNNCIDNKLPNGEACNNENTRSVGGTIQCVCTAKKCSRAGTCVSTPVFASSYSDSQCASNCSSNADCSSGSIRETN